MNACCPNASEGFGALYRGYPPTLLRAIAMNVGQMMTYDVAKGELTKHLSTPIYINLSSAAAAGFACAWLSLPFDMMKTRLQNMQPDPKTGLMPYTGVGNCAYRIFTVRAARGRAGVLVLHSNPFSMAVF